MVSFKTYKKEFEKNCPKSYTDADIYNMYFYDYIIKGIENGFHFTNEFLKENLEPLQIYWLNKHKFPRNQIR